MSRNVNFNFEINICYSWFFTQISYYFITSIEYNLMNIVYFCSHFNILIWLLYILYISMVPFFICSEKCRYRTHFAYTISRGTVNYWWNNLRLICLIEQKKVFLHRMYYFFWMQRLERCASRHCIELYTKNNVTTKCRYYVRKK